MEGFIGDLALTFFCEVAEPQLLGNGYPFYYTKLEMSDCDPEKVLDILSHPEKLDALLLGQRQVVAGITGVPVENVRLISKQEYLEKSGDTTESIATSDDGNGEEVLDWDDDESDWSEMWADDGPQDLFGRRSSPLLPS